MVRRDVAGAKIARAQGWLADADARFGTSAEAFAADRERRDLAIFYLFLAIQECIDLAAHWVSDEGWDAADDAGSTFDVLASRGVVDRPLADAMRSAVGLRNRIAHGYALLDHARIHEEARSGVVSLRAFLVRVADVAGV